MSPAQPFRMMLAALAALAALISSALADDVHVAVAANFAETAKEIGAAFEAETGHKAVFSFGSTGQLYAQIAQGAPYDVFLAADQARPEQAIAEGYAVAASRFTYASGRIVLYSADENFAAGEETLRKGAFNRLAVANPATAPYGAAAVETMKALGVYDALKGKLVQGLSIAQTYQFVVTGNAELGFVALSQIAGDDAGSRWLVPEALYTPIAQDAVLLKNGEGDAAAEAFLDFLKSAQARGVIERYGYAIPAAG